VISSSKPHVFGEKLLWYFSSIFFSAKTDRNKTFAKNSVRFNSFIQVYMVRFRSKSLSKVLEKVDTFEMYLYHQREKNVSESSQLWSVSDRIIEDIITATRCEAFNRAALELVITSVDSNEDV
jgi:hypothetical protein